jgi:MarR family transcriptional regulator for hemolysin
VLIELDDPHLEFIRNCQLFSRRWRSMLDERLRPVGLTLARWTVLFWLSQSDGIITQRELADLVGIEGPTLVRQLHALEAQGLVERVPFPSDRRAKGIRLTDKAAPVLEQINSISENMRQEFLGSVDRRKLHSTVKLLREIRSTLD